MIEFLVIGLHMSIYTKKTISEWLQIQVAEDVQQHVMPQHHDSCWWYDGQRLTHHRYYIRKISTEVIQNGCTYFFEVGFPSGLISIIFKMPKNISIGCIR